MSSYISPAPQGDPKATGAYAVAIAATASATNNDGHALDSAGNVIVDFAWGNFPIQPNDIRNANPSYYATGGGAGDHAWAPTTDIDSAYLAFSNITKTLNYGVTRSVVPDSHELAESGYSSYPAFTAGDGNYVVTAASGNGATVTYTSMNWLKPGDVVTITGCPDSTFNLASQTVVTATRQSFTVSNAAGSGVTVTGFYGKAQNPNAVSSTDGAYIGGVAYVKVPNVINFTTASATDALKDASLVVTVASGATNTEADVSEITRPSGSTTITLVATNDFTAGEKVRVSATGDAALDADYTVVFSNGAIFTVDGTATSSVALSGLSAKAKRVPGTIKTQNPVAGAASVVAGAAATITPWA